MSLQIRSMRKSDEDAVLAIYAEGIATGHATFQSAAPGWRAWDEGHVPDCRLIAEEGKAVVGWAALAPVSVRPVYKGVAEISVYVTADVRGQGVGEKLLSDLIKESEKSGYWTLQAGIFPENEASMALHRKHGFRVVGVRERLGQMAHGPMEGKWRDVVLMERRSLVAGV